MNNYLNFKSIKVKDIEIETLSALRENLQKQLVSTEIFDNYIMGYQIPQISKEFDLLRFDQDSVVNIELKSSSTPDRIKKQLLENRYYLSFLNKEIYSFTFVKEGNKIYFLNQFDDLEETDFGYLSKILITQKAEPISNIDSYFQPSNYLVSPFNSTDSFVSGKYFLTNHQIEIKDKVLKLLSNDGESLISITGKAGTGKTLLVYDIASNLMNAGERILIIHCGQLNVGQSKLIDEYNWDIIPIKIWRDIDYSQYHTVIIDEVQRIYPKQLDAILGSIKENGKKCIFSYDGQQCLSKFEIENRIVEKILGLPSLKVFNLTEKIRTNKEIANFIYGLFNRKFDTGRISYSNVQIQYCFDCDEANAYISYLVNKGWKIINYTPSRYTFYPYDTYERKYEDSAHAVIGQEYEKVIAVIDEYFYYKDAKLSTRGYKNNPIIILQKCYFRSCPEREVNCI